MSTAAAVKEFFAAQRFAVVGASTAREKYGNKVLRWYKDAGYNVTPINPREKMIESLEVVPSISELKEPASEYSISVITPPKVTKGVLEEAEKKGFKRIWLQPGSEDPNAIAAARSRGLNVIADGMCVLVNGLRQKL